MTGPGNGPIEAAVDLAIVGAGPSGMAAAARARSLGLSVLVLDEQAAPGGQIWRAVETVAGRPEGALLGDDYRAGLGVAAALRACGADYRPRAQVWQIEPGWRVFFSCDGAAAMVQARCVLLATGAQERPVPFPGWTLPGVLTVGAAQILLKTAWQVPVGPTWIAGCGPLPLLYAVQLLRAGGSLAGFLDTAPPGNRLAALPHLPAALSALADLRKGLGWLRRLRRASVPVLRGVTGIEALGGSRLEAVRYRDAGGERTAPASALLVHEGVIPGIHASMALDCRHAWRDDQQCWVPVADAWRETSRDGVFVAGDAGGIGGAGAALPAGEIAAIGAARRLGRLDDRAADRAAAPLRRQLRRALAIRSFVDALYRPRPELYAPTDGTVVCRCEGLTAGEIRAAAGPGTPGPNQVKAFTRAGMGPCQGRQCGYTVAHLLAAAQGRPVAEVGFYRIRPPLKPLTLGELAALDVPEPSA